MSSPYPKPINSPFSDWILYADESGDHSLERIDGDFPVFVLAICLFKVDEYVSNVVPAIQRLKFQFFGHDMVILHEREIRREQGEFSILFNRFVRAEFFDALNAILDGATFRVATCIVDKRNHHRSESGADNPYELAMRVCLEKALQEIRRQGGGDKKIFAVFESRGKREDANLLIAFDKLLRERETAVMARTFEPIFVSKKTNSSGLQIADMVARPLGIGYLRPEQQNRSLEIIRAKLC